MGSIMSNTVKSFQRIHSILITAGLTPLTAGLIQIIQNRIGIIGMIGILLINIAIQFLLCLFPMISNNGTDHIELMSQWLFMQKRTTEAIIIQLFLQMVIPTATVIQNISLCMFPCALNQMALSAQDPICSPLITVDSGTLSNVFLDDWEQSISSPVINNNQLTSQGFALNHPEYPSCFRWFATIKLHLPVECGFINLNHE